MMKHLICTLASLLILNATGAPHLKVDWPSFHGQHDLVLEQLPRQWKEGVFAGNSQLGMMVYATLKDNRVDFHHGRQDVTDHRKAPDKSTSMDAPDATVIWDFPRLDIDRTALRPAGKIKDGTLRQNLWNAEIAGTITAYLGELKARSGWPIGKAL